MHDRQKAYCAVPGKADQSGKPAVFIEYLLETLMTALGGQQR